MTFCDTENPGGGGSTFFSRNSAEAVPLLPGPQASLDEWARFIPLKDLPPLPKRDEAYFWEPCCGSIVVVVLSVVFISVTQGAMLIGPDRDSLTSKCVVGAMYLWASIAILSTLFILFGRAGEIQRSEGNCYPIPEEVATRLLRRESLQGMANISGPDGRTFCVRCLVWRPGRDDGKSHHCNTCQRCVRGFDHHCGVFGRCIVRGNMVCFMAVIIMLFCAMVTAGAAFVMSSAAEEESGRGYSFTTLKPTMGEPLPATNGGESQQVTMSTSYPFV